MTRGDAISRLRYNWKERGDIERGLDWDEHLDKFPDLKRAYEEYKYRLRVFSMLLDDTYDNEPETW